MSHLTQQGENSNNQNTNQQWFDKSVQEKKIDNLQKKKQMEKEKEKQQDTRKIYDKSVTQEEVTMMDIVQDNMNWITVAGKIRRYKAIINIKHLSEGTINNKIHTVNHALAGKDHFMGAKLHFYNKEQFIMAEFGCKEAMENACTLQLENDNDHKLEGLNNRGDQETKDKTLIVKDLPLNANKEIIKGILENKTGINIIDIKNKISGP
jgi:hypothetical protein